MTLIDKLLLLALLAALSTFFTGLVRRYALAHSLLDVPNARSSHSMPTPRGGGVAIVLMSLFGLLWLAYRAMLPWGLLWALTGAGILVATVGFVDDHRHVAARWRLIAHFSAAIWALAWLGGMPPFALPGMALDAGWAGWVLGAVYLVWLLNLYNFMDGIDGLASVEAVCVCLGGALLYAIVDQPRLALVPLTLCAAVSGFLYWNFPSAKIFMGDAGSGFLGIVFGVLSLHAAWIDPHLLWAWAILLGVFITDATLTLARRLLRGDRVHEAHRSHAYQHASRDLGRHLPVTLCVGAINVLWLLPIALLVAAGVFEGLVGLLLAYTPLVVLALKFRAGQPEALRG